MPHVRAQSWVQSQSQVPPWKNHSRTVSVPAVVTPAEYLPLPYVKPALSRSPELSTKKIRSYPPPILPARPEAIRSHPRHELQRRSSPISPMFSDASSSPTSPLCAPAVQPHAWGRSRPQTPNTGRIEDQVYVLTLNTTPEIAKHMQTLRERWFPSEKLKVPAHITLFHALPGSQFSTICSVLDSLSHKMRRFQIGSGKVIKKKTGVMVNVGAGDREVRRVFVSLRTSLWSWLSDQDRAFGGHWTVQNKENDVEKVDEAFRDVTDQGQVSGWAIGLVLWRYEDDGRWSKEREFTFATDGGDVTRQNGPV